MWPSTSKYTIPSKRDNYRDASTETARIDMHNLTADLRRDMSIFARNLARQRGPYFRHHSLEQRLKKYIGKPSRCGTYVQVQENEVDELMKPHVLLEHAAPVEAGLNKHGQICKVAYTSTLNSSGRVLFMCIGTLDGGLKTWYVNPTFKWRKQYQCTDQRVQRK